MKRSHTTIAREFKRGRSRLEYSPSKANGSANRLSPARGRTSIIDTQKKIVLNLRFLHSKNKEGTYMSEVSGPANPFKAQPPTNTGRLENPATSNDPLVVSFNCAIQKIHDNLLNNPNKKYLIGRITTGPDEGTLAVYKKGLKAWWDQLLGKVNFKHITNSNKRDNDNDIVSLFKRVKVDALDARNTDAINHLSYRILSGRTKILKSQIEHQKNRTPYIAKAKRLLDIFRPIFKEAIPFNLESYANIPEIFWNTQLKGYSEDYRIINRPMKDFLPAKPPTKSTSRDPILCKKWVDKHPENLKPIAQKLIDNINHVSHDDFEASLKNSVNNFNNFLEYQSNKDYVVVIHGRFDKSALWATSLAAKFLKYPPTRIIMLSDPDFQKTMDKLNPANIVVIDDAAYSGAQMGSECISNILTTMSDKPIQGTSNATMHMIIPFMTEAAIERMRRTFERYNVRNYELFYDAIIESFKQHLTPAEATLLSEEAIKISNGKYMLGDTLTTTYFDHKKGDLLSLVPAIDTGASLCAAQEDDPPILFVGKVQPPYKKS